MIDDDGEITSVHSLQVHTVSPPKARSAFVIVLSGRTEVGKMHQLRQVSVIGRGENADVRIDDEGVSRRHAQIILKPDGEAELVDLGSTNGTLVNGQKVATCILKDGDKLQMGGTALLKFSFQDALAEQLQKNLYDSATRDGLTRLYNRKYLLDALEKEFSYTARHKVPLTFVMLDLDHFKKLNDTYGHPAGDAVLQSVAEVLTNAVRLEDVVARYGGEEFALILRETPQSKALVCVERIRASIEAKPVLHEGRNISVTCSIGVVSIENGTLETCDEYLRITDEALYRAKSEGRNRIISLVK